MARITVDDLKKIKEKVIKKNTLSKDGNRVRITVHLGTCGIAAGGDKVFEALKEEIDKSKKKDIDVVISGCAGMCSSEPNVTVECLNEDAVIYYDLDAGKMREIFQGHALDGKIQSDYALARVKQTG